MTWFWMILLTLATVAVTGDAAPSATPIWRFTEYRKPTSADTPAAPTAFQVRCALSVDNTPMAPETPVTADVSTILRACLMFIVSSVY